MGYYAIHGMINLRQTLVEDYPTTINYVVSQNLQDQLTVEEADRVVCSNSPYIVNFRATERKFSYTHRALISWKPSYLGKISLPSAS